MKCPEALTQDMVIRHGLWSFQTDQDESVIGQDKSSDNGERKAVEEKEPEYGRDEEGDQSGRIF